MIETVSITKLYYRYGKLSDEEIRKHLQTIQIVVLTNHGPNTVHGYYELSKESMDKILEKPREVPIAFDTLKNLSQESLTRLQIWKTITFLVKSTSRFCLKPDIGEVLDQIDFRDLHEDKIKAIYINRDSHELLPDTQSEHYLMEAELLIEV